MTSPFIQQRNRSTLLSRGYSPLLNNTPEPQNLIWQQNDQQRVDQQNAMHDAIAIRQKPVASAIGTQQYNTNLDTIKNISRSATAGTVASVQTQQAAKQAAYQQQMAGLAAQSQAGMNTASLAGGLSSGGSQGVYSGGDSQLATYARSAGFPESQIPTAIAIMKAESGGNPNAVNTANSNGTTDTGIFQINSVHSNWTSGMNLKDPYQNAKAAFKVWSDAGGSWSPWSTFNNKSYQKYLSQPSSYTSAAPGTLPPSVANTGSGLRSVAVDTAMHAIGLPYVWGGNNINRTDKIADGVDCSGLVDQVYKSLGISLGGRTADQLAHTAIGTRTTVDKLRPGDLVAWQGGWRGPNYVGHIAIYAGNGQIIEAPSQGVPVRRRALRAGEATFGVALHFNGE